MAKQGHTRWERTMFGLTFYRLYNDWYIRRKSRLTRRRVKTSKRFVKTMQSANRIGVASKLASPVYRALPKEWRIHEHFNKLTGIAFRMLKEDRSTEDILVAFEQQLQEWGYRKEIVYEVIPQSSVKLTKRTLRKPVKAAIKQEEEIETITIHKPTLKVIRTPMRSFTKIQSANISHHPFCGFVTLRETKIREQRSASCPLLTNNPTYNPLYSFLTEPEPEMLELTVGVPLYHTVPLPEI